MSETADAINGLRSAVSSGDGQQISVELAALEAYYARLWDFHDRLGDAIDRVRRQSSGALETGQGDDVDSIIYSVENGLKGATPRIDGVIAAVHTARMVAQQNEHGLAEALTSVRNQVGKNLADVYECYQAYVDADSSGSVGLGAASAPLA